jgi:hypothetical protein
MKATRPALAYRFERATDEPSSLRYSEALQISLLSDGTPAVTLPGSRIETFAERDRPEPSTNTRAERDPGDLDGVAWPPSQTAETKTLTEASRDRDDDGSDPDESFADDLVTGIVAF